MPALATLRDLVSVFLLTSTSAFLAGCPSTSHQGSNLEGTPEEATSTQGDEHPRLVVQELDLR